MKIKENILEDSTLKLNNKICLETEYSLTLFPPDSFYPNIIRKIPFSKKNIFLCFKHKDLTKKLQNILMDLPTNCINYIINELSGKFREVIKDKNGNYFFSDLIKSCNIEQRLIIIKEIASKINEDCNDEYATHSLQTLFEYSSTEEESKLLISSFNDFNKIIMASMNKYGNYVIQRLITYVPEEIRKHFNEMFVKLICVLSRDAFGVLTVIKFINFTKEETLIKQFLNSIMTNFINISENPYGNYLIQNLLKIWWNKKEGNFLKIIIISKFQTLSRNEYASHICKTFIELNNNALINK